MIVCYFSSEVPALKASKYSKWYILFVSNNNIVESINLKEFVRVMLRRKDMCGSIFFFIFNIRFEETTLFPVLRETFAVRIKGIQRFASLSPRFRVTQLAVYVRGILRTRCSRVNNVIKVRSLTEKTPEPNALFHQHYECKRRPDPPCSLQLRETSSMRKRSIATRQRNNKN